MAGRGSRFHRKLSSARWSRTRRQALDRDGWRCRTCGRAGALEAHHVLPLHRGGAAFDLGNIETRCRSCHIEEHKRKLSPEARAWADLLSDLTRGV
jgi:5-methylcytosine-specific restriction endonuclease McrA